MVTTSKKTILVLGAGAIVIGQGCEFDYSGTQACKQLKNYGFKVVLVNPNPATIMTDLDVADRTYIEPLNVKCVSEIIERERPGLLLPIVGGQTALNLTIELSRSGILQKYGVQIVGVSEEAISNAEDRQKFRIIAESIGLSCPRSVMVTDDETAESVMECLDFPVIIRPSFTLGGLGGGIAYNKLEYRSMIAEALSISPQIQVDQSLIGWKEYEFEVVLDCNGNAIVVCAIENIDPVGVHTGDSVTVTPVMTLTDKEYQKMRNAAISILKAVGIRGSGANVQFAVSPQNGEVLIIEINPRVSRSSALASKATGFPIAKIATFLALGNSLADVSKESIGSISVAFEPALDYVVVKAPRFDFNKFNAPNTLSTAMRSTGEVMAMGSNFVQALQKALCSLEKGYGGLDSTNFISIDDLQSHLSSLREDKVLYIADAIRMGVPVEKIYALTHCDPWFIRSIALIVDAERSIVEKLGDAIMTHDAIPSESTMFWRDALLEAKKAGLSDQRIAVLLCMSVDRITNIRRKLGVSPIFKRVDMCAGEFETDITYLYSCYVGDCDVSNCEVRPSSREKIVILGNGCSRIGQGIEFDYACVHACMSARRMGYETIMINSNPSTVSTDCDVSDRLYVEPIVTEYVTEVLLRESKNGTIKGVIVQMGGQTPLKIAKELQDAGFHILGTPIEAIDLAEDREKFSALLGRLGLRAPRSAVAHSAAELDAQVQGVGYPVLLRPSYVLGGESMSVIYDSNELGLYKENNPRAFQNGPVLIDEFLENAIEIDVETICDGEQAQVVGIMEHIEVAGVHSGDSTCSLPTRSLSQKTISDITSQTENMAVALGIVGFLNVQYAIKDDVIYVLEANPRASRTVPFVAKATCVPIVQIATEIMCGAKLDRSIFKKSQDWIAVKMPVFPFNKFATAETILGPQMRSTGETMGIDKSFGAALAKASIAAGNKIPVGGNAFISISDSDKNHTAVEVVKQLCDIGFNVLATVGTAAFLRDNGIMASIINKAREGRPHIVDLIINNEISLIINTTSGSQAIKDSHSIRRTALAMSVPCITTIHSAVAMIDSIRAHISGSATILALQDLA